MHAHTCSYHTHNCALGYGLKGWGTLIKGRTSLCSPMVPHTCGEAHMGTQAVPP